MPPDLPVGLKLRGRRLKVYEAIRRAGPQGITSDRIFDKVYADDPDGSPETGFKIVSVVVCHLNIVLRPFGQKLQGQQMGHGNVGEYRLVRIDA